MKYSSTDIEEAKLCYLKIGYGARPLLDLPFIRQLSAEIYDGTEQLLRLPEYAHLNNMYNDRPNPPFSRLAKILSFDEASMTNTFIKSVMEYPGDDV